MNPIRSLALSLALVLPAVAMAGERVYLLRTEENAAVPALCPDGDTVKLGAFVYAPRPRAHDGRVVREGERPIGTAVGCGQLKTYSPYSTPSPFSIAFDLGHLDVFASGFCVIADLWFPNGPPAPLMQVGCTLTVTPDPAHRIVRGFATSASVFLPVAIPGYETGSYWTVHLYMAD
ncbi:MAG TPA: hypothetical protein VLU43_11270 [Anaeromyxobacteraceae bacterium]|nr:hypothetical protein [Anaeromyxobacteraceae bacterium]